MDNQQNNNNKNSGLIGSVYSPVNEGSSRQQQHGTIKSYTTRRPRQRSTVLVRERKILIMDFQNLSLGRPEEYGKPGDEIWMQKLLEFMHIKDKEVQLNDLHRWSRTHPWILNPLTSAPPFMDYDFYDTSSRGNYDEPTQSSVSVPSTSSKYTPQVSSSSAVTTFTNRQWTNNNNLGNNNYNNDNPQQQQVYQSFYNTNSTNVLPVSSSSSSSIYTKYDYTNTQDIISSIKYESMPYAVTPTSSNTIENLIPTPPSTSRTSVNTPVSFPSYDDISTEINYHAIPSFPATISTVMDTSPVSTVTNYNNNNNNNNKGSSQYNSQMLSMEEKDIKYGNAFCAIVELYRIDEEEPEDYVGRGRPSKKRKIILDESEMPDFEPVPYTLPAHVIKNLDCPGDGHCDIHMEINSVVFRKICTPIKTAIFEKYNNNKDEYADPSENVNKFFFKDPVTTCFRCRPWTLEDRHDGYVYMWTCCCSKKFIGHSTHFSVPAVDLVMNDLAATFVPTGNTGYGCGSTFDELNTKGHHIKKKSIKKLFGVKREDVVEFRYINRHLFQDELMVDSFHAPHLVHSEALQILLDEMEIHGFKRPCVSYLHSVEYSNSPLMYSSTEVKGFNQQLVLHKELRNSAQAQVHRHQNRHPTRIKKRKIYATSQKKKDRDKKYLATPKGQAMNKQKQKKYATSEKGRATRRRIQERRRANQNNDEN